MGAIAADVAKALESVSTDDLLLVLVAANEEPLGASLAGVLAQSRHYASALEAARKPIRRKNLAQRIGVRISNMNKTTDPLVDGGWLRVLSDSEGLVFRRSPLVDRLLRGRGVRQWMSARKVGR